MPRKIKVFREQEVSRISFDTFKMGEYYVHICWYTLMISAKLQRDITIHAQGADIGVSMLGILGKCPLSIDSFTTDARLLVRPEGLSVPCLHLDNPTRRVVPIATFTTILTCENQILFLTRPTSPMSAWGSWQDRLLSNATVRACLMMFWAMEIDLEYIRISPEDGQDQQTSGRESFEMPQVSCWNLDKGSREDFWPTPHSSSTSTPLSWMYRTMSFSNPIITPMTELDSPIRMGV